MNDHVDVTLGRRLKARRRLLGITQKGLANHCGVTFQQVQKYECAASRISATMLWRLACLLDVEVSYFFSGIVREGAADCEHEIAGAAQLAVARDGSRAAESVAA